MEKDRAPHGRRHRLKLTVLAFVCCCLLLCGVTYTMQKQADVRPYIYGKTNTSSATVCLPMNLTVKYPCMPYTENPFNTSCDDVYAKQRQDEADEMQQRFFATYNSHLLPPCMTASAAKREAAVPYTLLPATSTNIKDVNLHFSCAALRSTIGWQPSDVTPQAREYLRRYVRFAVMTGSSKPRKPATAGAKREPPFGATDFLRVRMMSCLWMYALEGDGVVNVFTDDNRSLDSMPGTPEYDLHNYVWHQMTEERVAFFSDFTPSKNPPWLLAQYRFFHGAETLYEQVLEQPQVRWVAVIDDDSHVQLNRLASLLHRRQLEMLYRNPNIPWRDVAPETNKTWEVVCVSLTVPERRTADAPGAHEPCMSLPRAMASLHTMLQKRVGANASLDDLLTWLGDLTAMQQDATRVALWEQSQRLLPPWALARLVPSLYVSAQPFGGPGHFFMRGALRYLSPPAATHIKREVLSSKGNPSDAVMWYLLPRAAHENHLDVNAAFGPKSDATLAPYYEDPTNLVLCLRERSFMSWCCSILKVNHSPLPQQSLWHGRAVSLHQKENMRDDQPQTLWMMGLYHVALYKEEEELRQQALLVLKERIRSRNGCPGC